MLESFLPELTLKISINNQVTLGLQNVFRKPKDSYQPLENNGLTKYQIASLLYKSKKQKLAVADESFDDRLNRLYPPLDIKKKSQRAKKSSRVRVGFGKNSDGQVVGEKVPPFGVRQGQKLRESGAAIDLLVKKQGGACRIVTLTLVGDTKEAFETLAANSGYVVNRLFQFVRRHGEGCNHWFFVWEYQKRGALHLHICLYHETNNKAAKLGAKLVQSWYKILRDLEKESGVDMFVRRDKKTYTPQRKWQSRNEPMRKSAGGYFSKYASKASKKEERKYIQKLAAMYPPSRFWGSSRMVKNIIKENTHTFSFESWKSDESKFQYERMVDIVNEFDIKSYGMYEFLLEKEYTNRKGKVFKRTLAEGFKQNFYFSPEEFEIVKDKIISSWRE